MPTTPQEAGKQLGAARETINYILNDLAETCGLTVREIAAVENGTPSSPDYASRIALSLGVLLD